MEKKDDVNIKKDENKEKKDSLKDKIIVVDMRASVRGSGKV